MHQYQKYSLLNLELILTVTMIVMKHQENRIEIDHYHIHYKNKENDVVLYINKTKFNCFILGSHNRSVHLRYAK